jgi:2-phosphosulfolactate phosphatase
MRLDVHLTPGEIVPADLADRTVVIIDTLRASSSIVQALSEGAKAIYPVASIEEALRLANTFGRDEVLLCGERRCLPIEGFDLGNSPREFVRDRIGGKTLVMTTTNGTAAIAAATGASRILIGAPLNLGAVVAELARTGAEPVLLCAGRERRFAIEDATTAGLIAQRLMDTAPIEWTLNDGAVAALALAREFGVSARFFATTAGGRSIVEAGLVEDLEFCARIDLHDLLPVLRERHITLLGNRD